MSGWSDDERLWDIMTPALSAPFRYRVGEAEVEAILDATTLPAGAAVLDLACGAGIHVVPLSVRGFSVTGVDRSAVLLRIARDKSEELGLSPELILDDMRSFVRPAAFDLVCSLNSSFAWFDDGTNARVLRNAAASCGEQGVLIVDTLGEGILAREEDGPSEIGGALYHVRRSFDRVRRRVHEEWSVYRNGETESCSAEQRIYTPEELERVLVAAGMGTVIISASLDGNSPYTNASLRMVAMARRR